jgi:dissimilatory sulfite reductase (desulfoviridin) alpha/beta subunit
VELDAAALKSNGFFQQIEKDKFSLRLCMSGGIASAEYVKKAVEIAEKYGKGQLHFTTRQQIEIPFIAEENVGAVQETLAKIPIKTFIGGPRVRTVVACVGAGICKFAQIETGALAQELHDRYFGRELPAKLKIAVTGCQNNCAKVEINDIGIRGFQHGYLLYFGGCMGHETRIGSALLPVISEKATVLKVIETTVRYFASHAQKGERLGKFIDRTGIEEFKKTVKAEWA